MTKTLPTIERLALASLRGRFPNMRRKGFSKAVRMTCRNQGQDLPRISIIPDGWFVSRKRRALTFTCIEIEDGNPLSREKLWLYCDLADTLDFCGHDLRLFVFDRYGHNERELDLIELYLNSLVEMARAKPSGQPPKRTVSDRDTVLSD